MVTHNQQHSAKRPASQGSANICEHSEHSAEPNKIVASTPYDFPPRRSLLDSSFRSLITQESTSAISGSRCPTE